MWLAIGIIVLLLGVLAVVRFNPQFGGRISPKLKLNYERSPQWDGKKFLNSTETVMNISLKTLPGLLKQQFTDRKSRSPQSPLFIIPFEEKTFNTRPDQPKFIWYGHSVLLLQINGKNLLIDPMFGPNAAPIAPFAVKRFSEDTLELIDSLPAIDLVLITHDHYDHLDYASIKRLRNRSKRWFVALGVSRHLERWGVPKEQISEFDWWQKGQFEDIEVTFTPSRHFSGRGLSDRAKCLWGGWVFKTTEHSIYWSGDSGYGTHFKEIGEQFGPFDWGFMECGQYNALWHHIHMFPEEAVKASFDALVKQAIPVHWGGFPLALHTWKDPVERFVAEANRQDLPFLIPRPGEIIKFDESQHSEKWWEGLE